MIRGIVLSGVGLALAIGGIGYVMAEDGEHIPANWSPPIACESATDCGSPVAVDPKPEPTVTLAVEPIETPTGIDSIRELPSTGTGPGR